MRSTFLSHLLRRESKLLKQLTHDTSGTPALPFVGPRSILDNNDPSLLITNADRNSNRTEDLICAPLHDIYTIQAKTRLSSHKAHCASNLLMNSAKAVRTRYLPGYSIKQFVTYRCCLSKFPTRVFLAKRLKVSRNKSSSTGVRTIYNGFQMDLVRLLRPSIGPGILRSFRASWRGRSLVQDLALATNPVVRIMIVRRGCRSAAGLSGLLRHFAIRLNVLRRPQDTYHRYGRQTNQSPP
ncbi:hypothetical protein IWZ01DRAFT_171077 [Phyllosticta capitalensis]